MGVCTGDKMKPFCYVTNIWQVLRFLARGPWRVWRRMVLQKFLKMSIYINAQLVSACKWLSLMNNCCSFCQTGNLLFWSVYRCLVHLTLYLPQIKKSIGVRSGECGGHCTGPPLPIQRLGKHCSGILWHQGQSIYRMRHLRQATYITQPLLVIDKNLSNKSCLAWRGT